MEKFYTHRDSSGIYYEDEFGMHWESSRYNDLEGKPVERTKEEYPYSYDAFVTWKGDYQKGENQVEYSDRLFQWDSEKFSRCCKEVWGNHGQLFDLYTRSPESIEHFLSLYFEKK